MNRPFLVSFSGLDGSGKTQLVTLLKRFLKREGISYTLLHPVRDSIENKIARGLLGSEKIKDLAISRNSASQQKKISLQSYILRIIALIYYGVALRIKLLWLGNHYSVVIFDRYVYDKVVQIAYLRKKTSINFGKFFINIFPRPNLPFFLYVLPIQAIERKREAEKEGQNNFYFERKYQLFESGKLEWKLINIDNSILSVSQAKKKIISLFKKKYYRRRIAEK